MNERYITKMKFILTLIVLLMNPSFSHAMLISVPEYARGRYSFYGAHESAWGYPGPWTLYNRRMANTNTYGPLRSYFVYDLSSIDLSLAENLTLSLYQIDGGLHENVPPWPYINVWDVTTPIDKLKAYRVSGMQDALAEGIDIFQDLGTGDLYGSTPLMSPIPYRYEIPLSGEALNDLRDFFIVGVTVDPRQSARFGREGDAPIYQANLLRLSLREEIDAEPEPEPEPEPFPGPSAIPEPATMLLFGSGLLGAFLRRKVG
jgi:hypothetical protein